MKNLFSILTSLLLALTSLAQPDFTLDTKMEDYLKSKRNNNIKKISQERRNLRPNVESTMKKFKSRIREGKLKVRGL